MSDKTLQEEMDEAREALRDLAFALTEALTCRSCAGSAFA